MDLKMTKVCTPPSKYAFNPFKPSIYCWAIFFRHPIKHIVCVAINLKTQPRTLTMLTGGVKPKIAAQNGFLHTDPTNTYPKTNRGLQSKIDAFSAMHIQSPQNSTSVRIYSVKIIVIIKVIQSYTVKRKKESKQK